MSTDRKVSLIKRPPPGPESQRLIAREAQLLSRAGYGAIEERLFIARSASGSLIEDVDGNRYIDFGSGWGTNNIGNCNPEVVEAVDSMMRQAGVSCWTSAANSVQRLELAERLLPLCPKSHDRMVFLTTGTEAVEAALRFMRWATERPYVISFFGQFHGLSYGALKAGPINANMRGDLAPLMSGFIHAPYPFAYRTPLVSRAGGAGRATIEYIEDLILRYDVPANKIAGVLVEPVVGEAGVWIPPDDFLPGLRDLCDRHGWVLCIDEVQSGFGRCGKMWAVEHWKVDPDLMVIGKGLSGGSMPIAAVSGRSAIMDRAEGFVAGTYAGHPAACAAGLKTIEILYRDRLFDHANDLGRRALARLRSMQDRYAVIGEVRGIGLWIAVEFVTDRNTRERNLEAAARINQICLQNGLYCIHDNMAWYIRLQPPLNIGRDLFDQGLDILEDAIRQVDAESRRPLRLGSGVSRSERR